MRDGSARRNRLLVGAAAAMAACAMVAVTVERSGASLGAGNDSIELETVLGKKLPSWLDTGDVKLMPLNKLVHEREVDTKLKEGQAELREGKKKTQQLAYDNAAHPAKKVRNKPRIPENPQPHTSQLPRANCWAQTSISLAGMCCKRSAAKPPRFPQILNNDTLNRG